MSRPTDFFSRQHHPRHHSVHEWCGVRHHPGSKHHFLRGGAKRRFFTWCYLLKKKGASYAIARLPSFGGTNKPHHRMNQAGGGR